VVTGSSPRAQHYVDVSDAIDVGMASLRAHAAYLAALGDRGETEARMREGAAAVGAMVGVAHAIAFELI
jgi:hypothetical protein